MDNPVLYIIVTALVISIALKIALLVAWRMRANPGDPRPIYRVTAERRHLPRRAHHDDAGLDLIAAESVLLVPGQRHLVGTGVKGALPEGTVGKVHPRSGLAHKHGITVLNAPGVVDAGYRGEIKVNLINHGQKAHLVNAGDRIAQLLIEDVLPVRLARVKTLDDTARGDNGHGSTGGM